jgi:hypothetical protein
LHKQKKRSISPFWLKSRQTKAKSLVFSSLREAKMANEQKRQLRLRWRREREEFLRDKRGLTVKTVSPNRVRFGVLGRDVQFEFYQGVVVQRGGDRPYLQPEDHAYLFSLAEELMRAAFRAIRENQENREQSSEHKDPTPARDPRQTRFNL